MWTVHLSEKLWFEGMWCNLWLDVGLGLEKLSLVCWMLCFGAGFEKT